MEYFYAQRLNDDVELNWVILGEKGDEPVEGPDLRFHTPEYSQPMILGWKRNMLNELVGPTSDFILHWDDDDFYTPDRVQHQLDFHLEQGKAVSGYHSLLYSDGKGVYRYHDPTNLPWCAGTSLMYSFDYWNNHRFSSRQVAEDFFFCMHARNAGQLASQSGEHHVIARSHDDSTCHPKFGSRLFPVVPSNALSAEQQVALCRL